jgi:hypothetical protein
MRGPPASVDHVSPDKGIIHVCYTCLLHVYLHPTICAPSLRMHSSNLAKLNLQGTQKHLIGLWFAAEVVIVPACRHANHPIKRAALRHVLRTSVYIASWKLSTPSLLPLVQNSKTWLLSSFTTPRCDPLRRLYPHAVTYIICYR